MKVLTRRVVPTEARAVKADLAAITASLKAGDALNLGDQGKAVSALQRQLTSAGLFKGAVSGTFDADTAAAVAALQKAKGLEESGIVGGRTLKGIKSTNLFVKDGFEKAARVGQRGSDIARAERMLEKLGFRPGEVDGIFDKATAKAVERYRQADPQVSDKGQLIGKGFFQELSKASKGYNHEAYSRREVGGLKKHARLDALTARAAAKGEGIGPGAKGRAVLNVERHLEAAGFELGKPNAAFGSRTGAAIKAFQKSSGLQETGIVDEQTWSKLKNKLFAAKSSTSPAQRVGERDGHVKATEKRLKFLGFNPGKVDGHFTEATERAVRKFQRKNKLAVSGAVGGGTARVLAKKVKAKKFLQGSKQVTAYVNGSPRTIRVVPVGSGEYLRADAARAYKKLVAAARRDGISLGATSGFRSMAEQKVLWERYGHDTRRVARPGYSNHQNGIAMDISGVGGRGTAADRWLLNNAGRFGFKNYPAEFWHYDYVR